MTGTSRRPSFVVAAALAACLIAAAPVNASTLDQSHDPQPGNGATFIYAPQTLAQTFTAGASGALDRVDLRLASFGGDPGPLTVQIRAVPAGAPGTTVLASTTLPSPVASIAAWPASSWLEIDFASPALVSAGTKYAIVASAPSLSNFYGWIQGSAVYAAGTTWYMHNLSTWTEHGADFGFKTYVGQADSTPPTISVSHTSNGNNGWTTSSTVQIEISASDAGSGLAGAPSCTDNGVALPVSGASSPYSTSVSGEGVHTISCSVSDAAGNPNSAGDTVKIDSKAPVVAVTSPPDGASYILGASIPAAACSTLDPGAGSTPATGSGVASSAFPSTSGGTAAGVGMFTVTCSGASDIAGNNTANALASYSVLYDWGGFFQPIDNKDASGNYIYNKAKAGSTIPVKFTLAGDKGLNVLASGSPSSVAIPCPSSGAVDAVEEYTSATSGLKYDALANQYIYNWKTGSWSGTCRQLVVKLIDGSEHRANFQFVK